MGKKKRQARRKHVPQRSCIVCRRKDEKRQLTRLVRTPDEGVVVDPTGKRNGRGAYLCRRPACWDSVLQNARLLNKALKTAVSRAELDKIAAYKPAVSEVNELHSGREKSSNGKQEH